MFEVQSLQANKITEGKDIAKQGAIANRNACHSPQVMCLSHVFRATIQWKHYLYVNVSHIFGHFHD